MKPIDRILMTIAVISAAVLILTTRVAGANSIIDLLWWLRR